MGNSKKRLKIALDYDETFTADRDFWLSVIVMAKNYRHHVSFVTYRKNRDRDDNFDIEADAKRCGIDVVYSCGEPKRSVFDADIWIDDSPETIVEP